jgi:hypothetical protein
MDDPAHVGHAEGASDVESDPRRLARLQTATASKPDGEVLPVDEGHHEVGLVPVRAGVQAGDDVRVTEDRRGEGLAPEPVGEVGVGRDLGTQDLDGHLALQAEVGGPVDRGHPAASDDRPEPIATTKRIGGGRRPQWLGRLGHAATIAETARTGLQALGSKGCRAAARVRASGSPI